MRSTIKKIVKSLIKACSLSQRGRRTAITSSAGGDEFPEEFLFETIKHTPWGMPEPAIRKKFLRLNYSIEDYYEHFPCFIGARTLARYFSLHECYQKTLGITGHIAEVGVFRGGVSLFFAKSTLIYEPQSLTQVHGFDWFREPTQDELKGVPDGFSYYEPYERVQELVRLQGLQNVLLLHKLNVVSELQSFFESHSHLQFKLVFLDAGEYYTVARSIREFWPRLAVGGIMVFDQYNHEAAPGETRAIKELLPEDAVIRTFPHGWMPTAYVIKGEKLSTEKFDGV
jgi:hypothetical protein